MIKFINLLMAIYVLIHTVHLLFCFFNEENMKECGDNGYAIIGFVALIIANILVPVFCIYYIEDL